MCVCEVRKGDLPPPNDEDQPAPKALLRLFKHINGTEKDTSTSLQKNASKKSHRFKSHPHSKKETTGSKQPQTLSDKVSCSTPSVGDEELGGLRGKAPAAAPPVTGRAAIFVRKPGETMRDYLERIDIESKARIVESFKKQKEKSTKRKKSATAAVGVGAA